MIDEQSMLSSIILAKTEQNVRECASSQCPMDPMVMENQRTEKSEELRLLYYLRIYGNTPPQSTVY